MRFSLRASIITGIFAVVFIPFNPIAWGAQVANVSVVCGNSAGATQSFNIGWDNSNSFFNGRGYIPRLYCEGGYAPNGYRVYVSDNLTDQSVGYYAGIVPAPTPSASPSASPVASSTPTPSPSPSASAEPSPTSTPETQPTPTPSPVEPTPSESPSPEPSPTPTADPTPAPVVNTVRGSADEGGVLTLSAPQGMVFTSVIFASYGTPENYTIGACHAAESLPIVAAAFVGQASASIGADNGVFGDPCGGTYKRLQVVLSYGASGASPSPEQSPEPSPTPTPETSTAPSPTPTPEPSAPESPEPTPTPSPQPSLEPTPSPEPAQTPSPEPPAPAAEPSPVAQPSPVPLPVVEPEPSPAPEPQPSPDPTPEPTPPAPSPDPEPSVEPSPDPEPTPLPEPSQPPVEQPMPEPSEPPVVEEADVTPAPEALLKDALADGKLSEAEKEQIANAIIEKFGDAPVPASALAAAGITYADLPPETPVEVRTDEDGNAIVITALIADALEVLADPAALAAAIFTDPAKALLALGSVGADMSPAERAESEKVVVASVVVGSIAQTAAAAGAVAALRRKP